MDRFNELSKILNCSYRGGDIDKIFFCLEEMSHILRKEEKYFDDMKVCMLLFHAHLQYKSELNFDVWNNLIYDSLVSTVTNEEMEEMYRDIAFSGKQFYFSAEDSFQVFRFLLVGKKEEAFRLLKKDKRLNGICRYGLLW